ncbi:23029_t:CDS:2 [Cetraspora pellucida]|uniref:23029_t:CDS:1 n=1 Tax=Cetraspora pellucida TaxID=1433469 RepID=A0A9N9EFA9_9GLOM|nr:23029_t:CDS:2 [Cetraspora pellucida]
MSQPNSDFDVKIIVGNEPNVKEFNAHSTVLNSCSLYFERALSERWRDQNHGICIIRMPNIHPTIFKLILDYIYIGKNICQISGEVSLDILVASDELELLDLAECAQKHLIDMFSPWLFSNIVASLNIICLYSHFSKLYNHILNYVFRNPYSLFDSTGYRLLDEAALICLLENDDLELEEIEIWDYLIKWGISKLSDENITNCSVKNIIEWSDDHFNILKDTISNCIPLIRCYYIPNHYIDKQIKQYHLDSTAFIKFETPQRRCSKLINNKNAIFPSSIYSVPFFGFKRHAYFSKTSSSFIFSITDQSNPVLSRIKSEKQYVAIMNDKSFGPCFGISDLCMINSGSWSSKRENY